MKWLFTTACFTLLVTYCMAQGDSSITASCISPKQCTRDLRDAIPEFANNTTSKVQCYARGCNNNPVTSPGDNFHNVTYAAGQGTIGCAGASADCSQMDGSILKYIAYYPLPGAIPNFNTCKLPVVIFFHGGSFADCNGTYDGSEIAEIGKNFAERGFIFISVEYRTGVKVESDIYYSVQQMLAIWRACQDALGAIRSIIKRELSTTAPAQRETQFHIDINNIFLAGNSAGSVIAMSIAYYTHQMFIDAFPPGIDDSDVLGDINQNYYYGGDGSGANGINFTIKGVVDLWGGISLPNPYTVSNPGAFFFKNGHTLPPTIAFCGALDPTFPPISKTLKFHLLTTESYCLNDLTGNTSYTVLDNVSTGATYGNIIGSQTIYQMLQNNGVLTEFYEDCDMKHGLDADCGGCTFNSTKNPKKIVA